MQKNKDVFMRGAIYSINVSSFFLFFSEKVKFRLEWVIQHNFVLFFAIDFKKIVIFFLFFTYLNPFEPLESFLLFNLGFIYF